MKKLEHMGAEIISQITANSKLGWPPECCGFIYQPERPVHECKAQANSANREDNAKDTD